MEYDYWKKQRPEHPIYPDIEWSKPQRRDQAGKLLIVGGNKLGFAAVAENYQRARETGAGQVKVFLPDCLKSTIPPTLTDVVFGACTTSGGLSKDAAPELQISAEWADAVLLIGDAGRNAETALLYEEFISNYQKPLTITRDGIDLVRNNPNLLVDRPSTLIVASFGQLQKLLAGVYYPKILTFNMQLLQLVEALHKFTVTYPCTIMTLHKDTIIVAHEGEVTTQDWHDTMAVWRGNVATDAACYWLWNKDTPLAASVASIVQS